MCQVRHSDKFCAYVRTFSVESILVCSLSSMDVRTAFMFETLLSVSSSPLTSIDSSCMSGREGGREGGEER